MVNQLGDILETRIQREFSSVRVYNVYEIHVPAESGPAVIINSTWLIKHEQIWRFRVGAGRRTFDRFERSLSTFEISEKSSSFPSKPFSMATATQ